MNSKTSSLTFKPISNTSLYNILQDLRHFFVVQLSNNKDNSVNLRGSYQIDLDAASKQSIIDLLEAADHKSTQEEAKYKSQQKIRRICFVDYSPLDANNPKLDRFKQLLESIDIINDTKLSTYKIVFLKDGLDTFKLKYPFLCLSSEDLNSSTEQKKQLIIGQPGNRDLLDKNETKILYSFSQFPFEIVEDQLFLGNVFHSNSVMYLEDLKIKSMIDFTQNSPDKPAPAFKAEKYTVSNIPLDTKTPVTLDFDEINQYIDQQLKDVGPVLLYCTNGINISPAFAIAYLMYKKKMVVQMASLKVFGMMGKVDISPWIYTQLLVYTPKY